MSLAPLRSPDLTQLGRAQRATVAAVDWHRLAEPEARRLRELGLDEGIEVELLRGSGLFGGPVACRVGRMRVALRRHVARAIRVVPIAAGAPRATVAAD